MARQFSSPAPLVALLSDFGNGADGYAGVLKLVILGLAPGLPLVDITHEIAPQDVRAGAWVLYTMWHELPPGSICVGVVDPGVGTSRRAVAFVSDDRTFVGPDNGLFALVLSASPATAAVLLDNPRYQRANPSSTFQGRDIFAYAAGHLAAGVPLADLGTTLAPETLDARPLPAPVAHTLGLQGQIVHVDRFGNLITNFGPTLAPGLLREPRLRLRVGNREIDAYAPTFALGPLDTPFAFLDSSRHLAIAVRNGSAAAHLRVARDAPVIALGATWPAGAGD